MKYFNKLCNNILLLFKFKIAVSILAVFIICSGSVFFWYFPGTLVNVNQVNQDKLDAAYYSNFFQPSFGSVYSKLTEPNAIAVNSLSGSIYVTDSGNHRIQQFSHNGTFIATWGSEGDANSQFKSPSGIAVNPTSGSVYVADTGNDRIQQFSHNGTFITTWGSYGTSSGQFVGQFWHSC